MKKEYNVYEHGDGWFKVDRYWLEGVRDINNIDSLEILNDRLKVTYQNGVVLWYQDCHGTWGFPTRFI